MWCVLIMMFVLWTVLYEWRIFYFEFKGHRNTGCVRNRVQIAWLCDAFLSDGKKAHNLMITSSNGNILGLMALCEGQSPVKGEFPSQRQVTRSFEVFFDLRLNKQLSKQSKRRWFETPLRLSWRHCNVLQVNAHGVLNTMIMITAYNAVVKYLCILRERYLGFHFPQCEGWVGDGGGWGWVWGVGWVWGGWVGVGVGWGLGGVGGWGWGGGGSHMVLYWNRIFRENKANSIPMDVLISWGRRSSAAMILTIQDKQGRVGVDFNDLPHPRDQSTEPTLQSFVRCIYILLMTS